MTPHWRSRGLDAIPAFLTDAAFYLFVFALSYAIDADGASSLEVALVFGIYTLSYAVLAPLLGRASDAKGRRTSVLAGALLFTGIAIGLSHQIIIEHTVIDGATATTVRVRSGLIGVRDLAYLGIAGLAVANGLFWPALQAGIGDRERTPEALGRVIGVFNVAWTGGKGAGFLVAGTLFALAPRSCLVVGAALGGLVIASLLLGDSGERAPLEAPGQVAAQGPGPHVKRAFLLSALTANLVLWGSLATLTALAPKLGETLSVGPLATGALLFTALVSQGAGFWALANSKRWAYRARLLALAVPGSMVGLALVMAAGRLDANDTLLALLLAGVGAATIGLAQAVTYAASVYYSLDYDNQRGLRTGIHEAMLALGGGLPILGGVLADATGVLQAPLMLMLGIAACGALTVGGLLRIAPFR